MNVNRMSIDALISFGRDENPNAQTGQAQLDTGDVILKLETDDQGNRYLRTAYRSDMDMVDSFLSLFNASRYNLKNVVSFIAEQRLLNAVSESEKDQVRTAVETLNNKIQSYNALSLRLPCCTLSEMPTDTLQRTEPVRKQVRVAETVQVSVSANGAGSGLSLSAQTASLSLSPGLQPQPGSVSLVPVSLTVPQPVQVNVSPALIASSRERLLAIHRELVAQQPKDSHLVEFQQMAKLGKTAGKGAQEFNSILLFVIDLHAAAKMSSQVQDIARGIIYDPRQHKILQKADGNLVLQAFADVVVTVGGKGYCEKIQVRVSEKDVYTAQELRAMMVDYFKLNYQKDTHLRRLLLSAMFEMNVSLDNALFGYTKTCLVNIDQAFSNFDSYIAQKPTEEHFINARVKFRQLRDFLLGLVDKSEIELAQSLTEIRNGVVPAFEAVLNELFKVKLDHKDKAAKKGLQAAEARLKKLKEDAEISIDDRLAALLGIFKTVRESIKKPFEQVTDDNKANMKRLGKFCTSGANLLNLICQMQKERAGILDMTVNQKIDISVTNPDKVFADYFKLVEKDGFWSALPEIYALYHIFNFNVEITTKQGGQRAEAPALHEYLPAVEGAQTFVRLDFEDKTRFQLVKESYAVEVVSDTSGKEAKV